MWQWQSSTGGYKAGILQEVVKRGNYTPHRKEGYLGVGLICLGWLNLKKSKSLARSEDKIGSIGAKLNLHCFLDRMDLNLGLLVKTGVGLLGKRVNSLRSLNVILHLFARISQTMGQHLRNWMHNGVGFLSNSIFFLGTSMASLLVCFMFEIVLRMCLLHPLCIKCFVSLLLYFLHTLYGRRGGVTDNPGHLTSSYAFTNMWWYITCTEGKLKRRYS